MSTSNKKASATKETSAVTSHTNSNTDVLKNQEKNDNLAFADYAETDPVEPENSKDVRGKFWCFVLYPESAPENWVEVLNLSGLAWACSPLHDKDKNPDGSAKKEHYHIIVIWRNDTTYNAVKQFTHVDLNSTVPQVLKSPVGYYRYFTHEDNPEKASYSKKDITSGNGFDIADYTKLTKEQLMMLHAQLTQMVVDNGIDNYADVCMMAMSMGFDEYEMVVSHTIHFNNLCKSVAYRMRQQDERS